MTENHKHVEIPGIDLADMDEVNRKLQQIMEGVELQEKAEVSRRLYWGGKHYDRSNDLR